MGVTMSRDKDGKARDLLLLLGLTEAQIEAALNGRLELIDKPTPVKRKRRIYKEYVLSRTAICKTCETKEVFFYYMAQPEYMSGLLSQPISKKEFMSSDLPVYRDWYRPNTCPHCKENLLLLEKEDLVYMLLKSINEGARSK